MGLVIRQADFSNVDSAADGGAFKGEALWSLTQFPSLCGSHVDRPGAEPVYLVYLQDSQPK